MNNFENFDSIENIILDGVSPNFKEKLEEINKFFPSEILPKLGVYGVVELVKDNIVSERIGKDEEGHIFKEYYDKNGLLYLKRKLENDSDISAAYYNNGIESKKSNVNISCSYLENSKLDKRLSSTIVSCGVAIIVSATENIPAYFRGEKTAEDMAIDIVKDVATEGIDEYIKYSKKADFPETMKKSSHKFMKKLGDSCLPDIVIDFAVDSIGDISDYVHGDIDGDELVYNLGENAARAVGEGVGGMIGGAIGAPLGPLGIAAGEIVGGAIGTVVAVEAYKLAVEVNAEDVEVLADKAQELAKDVIDTVSEVAPEVLDNVKNAFSNFVSDIDLPFGLGN